MAEFAEAPSDLAELAEAPSDLATSQTIGTETKPILPGHHLHQFQGGVKPSSSASPGFLSLMSELLLFSQFDP